MCLPFCYAMFHSAVMFFRSGPFADGFDEPAEILSGPDHGDGVEGIGFLFGPGDHLVNVFVPDHVETVR